MIGTWFLAEVWRLYKDINKILIVLQEMNVSIIVDHVKKIFSKLTFWEKTDWQDCLLYEEMS